MLFCKRCKKQVDIEKPVLRKMPTGKYTVNAICLSCNKPINKTLSKKQTKYLPKSIIDSNDSTFKDYADEKQGGILPLLPLLGLIFSGVAAASGVAGTVANSVIQSKKNEEEERHNREVEKIARGEGVSALIPLITAAVIAATEKNGERAGKGSGQSSRSLQEIVNNVDSMTDDEKRDMLKIFGGMGYVII